MRPQQSFVQNRAGNGAGGVEAEPAPGGGSFACQSMLVRGVQMAGSEFAYPGLPGLLLFIEGPKLKACHPSMPSHQAAALCRGYQQASAWGWRHWLPDHPNCRSLWPGSCQEVLGPTPFPASASLSLLSKIGRSGHAGCSDLLAVLCFSTAPGWAWDLQSGHVQPRGRGGTMLPTHHSAHRRRTRLGATLLVLLGLKAAQASLRMARPAST